MNQNHTVVQLNQLSLPAFIYDEQIILNTLARLSEIKNKADCKLFFAIKSCGLGRLLELCQPIVDGYAASSLFEAQWIQEIVGTLAEIHITAPAYTAHEMQQIMEICSSISFNSVNQFTTYAHLKEHHHFKNYLRINPQISAVEDVRYDPCATASKLGVPLNSLNNTFDCHWLDGIQIHTNCDSDNYAALWQTALELDKKIPYLLEKITAINLGGGYLFSEGADLTLFYKTVELFKDKYGLEVIIEPGAAISREAGNLVVTVLDMFTVDNSNIAIISGSVNHLPEVFEYQYHHPLHEETEHGNYVYKIAGPTCLAGDQFGIYHFDKPLQIGDILTFTDCGSYSLVKAHMFNGINLPSIYTCDTKGNLKLQRQFDYADFRGRWTK